MPKFQPVPNIDRYLTMCIIVKYMEAKKQFNFQEVSQKNLLQKHELYQNKSYHEAPDIRCFYFA